MQIYQGTHNLTTLIKRLGLKPRRGIHRDDLLQQISKCLSEKEHVKVVGVLLKRNITLVKKLPMPLPKAS